MMRTLSTTASIGFTNGNLVSKLLQRRIGEGGFGAVYIGKTDVGSLSYVLKLITHKKPTSIAAKISLSNLNTYSLIPHY